MGESGSTWQVWVTRQMTRHGWTTQADVVRSSTLTKSAVSQWLDPEREQRPSVENCRKAAEAFGTPILEALVAAGHLTPEEARATYAAPTSIEDFATLELVAALQRRVEEYEIEIKQLRADASPKRKSSGNRTTLKVPSGPQLATEGDSRSAVR